MDEATLTRYIKEIGRGKNAAGDLAREDAAALFAALLEGCVPDLHMGAILIALRVKGESLQELAGFAAACEASYAHLPALSAGSLPVVIPSYNGARKLANFAPLLALLLARAGLPVLLHGVTANPGRVSTCEVLGALQIEPARSTDEACEQLERRRLAFLPIDVLAPQISRLLSLRARLGLRNSTHTLAKMLQPFARPALRIVSVTHPEYLVRMREYFTHYDDGALLLRGAEGEAVAHPRREPELEWLFAGGSQVWKAEARHDEHPVELPPREADATARWIEYALAGKVAVPMPILHQVACCVRAHDELARAARQRIAGAAPQ